MERSRQLLQDRVEVCHTPVLGDLTVDDAHCIDGLEADFGARGSPNHRSGRTSHRPAGIAHEPVAIVDRCGHPVAAGRVNRLHIARNQEAAKRRYCRIRW